MYRTSVVKSRNLRKTAAFKLSNAIAIFLLLFIVLLSSKIMGDQSAIATWIRDHYSTVVSPMVLAIAVLIIVFSMVTSSLIRSPQRLGSLEIDTDEIRYLEHDEINETIAIEDLSRVTFEFFSGRMRGNPAGCMNYLTLFMKNGSSKKFEIEVGNTLEKEELGESLARINKKAPVKVMYSYFLKQLFKDKVFKF
jgi:hypothetical protein